ncbi:hypothetical protein [Roseibium sp. MB-4]
MAFSITSSFDSDFYLSQNPDVAAAIEAGLFESAEQHFNQFGFSEGRDPNPYFDTSFYLEQNPDVAAAGINPLNHFNQFGETEGRSPNAIFNPTYYLEQNPDVAASGISPFLHFINHGAGEGRSPNASVASQTSEGFDEAAYLAANPDIADAIANGTFSSGYEHWLLIGFDEGRSGAQNAAGDPIDQPNNSGTPSGNPDDSPADPDAPGTPIVPVATIENGEIELVNLSSANAVITITGNTLFVTASNDAERSQAFDLADVKTIDLNGFEAKISGATVNQLFPDSGSGTIDIVGFGSGGTFDITGVDFGNIKQQTLQSPNVWQSDQNPTNPTVAGFTFSELDGNKSILPDGVTVNGSRLDAFKAWWDSFDDFYAGGANYYNVFINERFVYLGNDYVDYLNQAGNSASLDVVKTSGDYTSRQQTLHDNLLGNLGDGPIKSRFEDLDDSLYDWPTLGDPRTTSAQAFGDRPYTSGNANTLDDFQTAKDWDIANGVSRADGNIKLTTGQLDDIASDGSNMWAGSGNSNDLFRIVQLVDQEIELGIKVKERKVGDYADSASTDLVETSIYKNLDATGWDAPSWNQPGGSGGAENVARWSFDFSIATDIDGTDADAPTLADYVFKLVFDVDPTENGESFVTLVLDQADGGNWLYESSDNAQVNALFNAITSANGTNIIISDNVGENDSNDPTYVSQNSQNYGFANSFERYVNTFLGNDYNLDGTKQGSVTYWEAESDAGHFSISLEAYDSTGTQLLGTNTIIVDGVVGP